MTRRHELDYGIHGPDHVRRMMPDEDPDYWDDPAHWGDPVYLGNPAYLGLQNGDVLARWHGRKPIRRMFWLGLFAAAIWVGADLCWAAAMGDL